MGVPKGGLLLLLLLVCHTVAVLLFCKGFLLRRVVIPEYSNCSHAHLTSSELDSHQHAATGEAQPGTTSCHSLPRRFKRVVWLLIDALRYDFVDYDSTIDPVPVYRNKLPFVRDLLRHRPQNARLYRFVADPPTTTMQRLKALTTGSLPTFIDIGSNFNSHLITEDSLPFQARASGRNLTFIGDDTWLGLYEGMLTKVFEYPSLNVKDLHTVDNGVIEHIVPELKKNDAEFVIGHFLGVDHVGHTYGSTHWTMGQKLSQMNEVLMSVFDAVDEESIVFVFGDHGMTVTGDHGGETELETTAALLVYTPTPLFPPVQHSGRALYQIDIVPTVSLLLGMPIPFSNLGMIIPEVFLPWTSQQTSDSQFSGEMSDGYKGRVTPEFLTALQVNAEQLQKYLKTYIKHSDDFPPDVYVLLQKKFAEAQKLHLDVKSHRNSSQAELTDTASAYIEYMREVKNMCHNVWAKFDDWYIDQGIILFTLTVVTTLITLCDTDLSLTYLRRNLRVSLALSLLISLSSLVVSPLPLEVGMSSILDLVLSLSFYPVLLFLIVHSITLCYYMWKRLEAKSVTCQLFSYLNRLSFTFVFSTVVGVSCSVSLVSNSFILYEGDMTVFLVQSMLICFLVQRAQVVSGQCTDSTVPGEEKLGGSREKTNFSMSAVLKSSWPLLLAMVLVRLSKLFHSCRDLQVGCESTSFTQPYHGAVETLGTLAGVRLLLSCLGVVCVPLALAAFVSRNSQCLSRWLLLCVYTALPLSSVSVCGFWLIQSLPQPTLDILPHWQHVIFPRVAYAMCFSTIVVCAVAPFRRSQSRDKEADDKVKSLDRTPSKHRTKLSSETVRQRQVATADVSTHEGHLKRETIDSQIVMTMPTKSVPAPYVVITTLLVAVWLPVALVLNDGIALSAVLMALQLYLIISSLSQSQAELSWPMVVLWGLVSSQFFFAFGHHATVVSLRFDAGFVGLHGEMSGVNLLCAGLLVGLNMLGSHLLLTLGLPLLQMSLKSENLAAVPSKWLLTTALQYIAFHSFKTLLTLLTASLQRRHLMVWGVFSPRFLYEAAFLGTTHVCVIITFLFTSSIFTSYTSSIAVPNTT